MGSPNFSPLSHTDRRLKAPTPEWQWITPHLVVHARQLLGWGRVKLASECGLPVRIITAFELGKIRGSCVQRMQLVFGFSRGGVRFFRRKSRSGLEVGAEQLRYERGRLRRR